MNNYKEDNGGNSFVEDCKYDNRYLIFIDGSIYSKMRKKILTAKPNGKNSPYVFVKFGSGKKKYYIHRLVAEHFIPNPKNLRDVDHIDHDPKNNHLSNLQWLSHKDNMARRLIPHPVDKVKKNPDQFVVKGPGERYSFGLQNQYIKINRTSFPTKELAIACRDKTFVQHFPEKYNITIK